MLSTPRHERERGEREKFWQEKNTAEIRMGNEILLHFIYEDNTYIS